MTALVLSLLLGASAADADKPGAALHVQTRIIDAHPLLADLLRAAHDARARVVQARSPDADLPRRALHVCARRLAHAQPAKLTVGARHPQTIIGDTLTAGAHLAAVAAQLITVSGEALTRRTFSLRRRTPANPPRASTQHAPRRRAPGGGQLNRPPGA